MSTTNKPTLRETITKCNQCLDDELRGRFGVTLRTYKTIKAVTQMVGVLAIVHAMNLGMDPGTGGMIIGAIIVGPEALETIIANSSGGSHDRR